MPALEGAMMLIRVNTRYPPDKVPRADPALTPDAYREKMAVPIMEAIDAMPEAYRALVNEIGYVEGYRAWRSKAPPREIAARFWRMQTGLRRHATNVGLT